MRAGFRAFRTHGLDGDSDMSLASDSLRAERSYCVRSLNTDRDRSRFSLAEGLGSHWSTENT